MVRKTCILLLIVFGSLQLQARDLKVIYKKNGKLVGESVNVDRLLKKGRISTAYIDTCKLSSLDSIVYKDGNPNKSSIISKNIPLDFTKKSIEKYSPEYYALYAVHFMSKSMEYYNHLFEGKIDFNSQQEYRNIEVTMGDVPLLSCPKQFIIEPNTDPSPSLFYHEVGHRAFWYLEGEVGVKFGGLTYVHMGLLEYFTISLNDFPVVGEDFFPPKLMRNASLLASYPFSDFLKLTYTFNDLKESFPKEMKNPKSNVATYYRIATKYYGDILNKYYDNHRSGMIVTSTLWRIRQKIGKDKMDKLVAKTILSLNDMMLQRGKFYSVGNDEKIPNKIEWYDLVYGLLQTDAAINGGVANAIIKEEFMRSGFPVERVRS